MPANTKNETGNIYWTNARARVSDLPTTILNEMFTFSFAPFGFSYINRCVKQSEHGVNAERCSFGSWHFSMHTHALRGNPVKRLLPRRTCHGTNKCRVSLICFCDDWVHFISELREMKFQELREFYGLLVYGSFATSFVRSLPFFTFLLTVSEWCLLFSLLSLHFLKFLN